MKYLISSLLLISTVFSFGQVEIPLVEILNPVNNQKAKDSGRNIQIISKEDISQIPANSVDDLIRFLPGVEVQSRGGFGVQVDITLRGATFNQTIVLVDGARLYEPLTGHFNCYMPVSISEIERVEIIKGAASAIYGPDAVGGVVNIITNISAESNAKSTAEINYGSNDYLGSDVFVSSNDGPFYYSIGSNYQQSKGEEYANPNAATIQSAPLTYRNNFRTNLISGAIRADLNEKWTTFYRTAFDERDFGAKYFYTTSSYDESKEHIKVWFNHFNLSRKSEKSRTKIDLTHRYGEDKFVFNPLFSKNFNKSQFYQLQVHHNLNIGSSLVVGLGGQSDYKVMQSIDRGNRDNFHTGIYALANYYLNNLVLNAAIRGDYDESYDLAISPSFSMAYHLNSNNFRLAVNKGIRAADFTERYVSTNLENLSSGRNLGNPNLQNEESWTYELGYDRTIKNSLNISLTGFYREASNLIDYESTSGYEIVGDFPSLDSSGIYFFAQNQKEVSTIGFETELRFKKKITNNKTLLMTAGYTFLDSKNSNGDISKYVSNHAKHLVNGAMSIRSDRYSIFISGIWKDKKTGFNDVLSLGVRKDYLMLNGGVNLNSLSKKYTFGLEVLNLGNVNAQDIYGAILPGRWFIGSVKINLNND